MLDLISRFGDGSDDEDCSCRPEDDGRTIDATECSGRLATSPECRETVIDALAGRPDGRVRIRSPGVEYVYEGRSVAVLAAAGRFATLAEHHDETLADRARKEPIEAARAATARAGPVSEIAAETGFAETVAGITDYESVFRPSIAPTISGSRTRARPPVDATLRVAERLPSGGTVRVYDRHDDGTAVYHLSPVEAGFDRATLATLELAYDRLAEHGGTEGEGVVSAIRTVMVDRIPSGRAEEDSNEPSLRVLADVLRKHTRGYGIIEDVFSDPAVSDAYATAPAAENVLWVVRDGEPMRTNVRLSADGAAAIASRLRRESGRSFSRAAPTLDSTAELETGRVRVAGVSDPATDGLAFAFRSLGREAFTLPGLVANGTVPADAAGLLSIAIRRDTAGLVAGTRGAGKTTLLGALLWELPATTRTIAIEDTPELPVETLQEQGRDVQPMRTTLEDGPGISPTEALRTALRMGDSALVLGEVRGEEAAVLYEAMRVGASGATVLGTIHGDGGADVRERVVSDLGVPESSFGSTDLLVTVEPYETATGDRARRVKRIEEVIADDSGVRFEALYQLDGNDLVPTGRIDQGNSRLLESLTRPDETYANVRERITYRGAFLGELAEREEVDPETVTTAYARRRDRCR